jgi:hypothetical protein
LTKEKHQSKGIHNCSCRLHVVPKQRIVIVTARVVVPKHWIIVKSFLSKKRKNHDPKSIPSIVVISKEKRQWIVIVFKEKRPKPEPITSSNPNPSPRRRAHSKETVADKGSSSSKTKKERKGSSSLSSQGGDGEGVLALVGVGIAAGI